MVRICCIENWIPKKLLSNQGEKSINCYIIMVPLKKKFKYGTPKPRKTGYPNKQGKVGAYGGFNESTKGSGL